MTNLSTVEGNSFELEVEPSDKLTFNLGSHQAPVGTPIEDTFILRNKTADIQYFKVNIPDPFWKLSIEADKKEGAVKPGHELDITVKLTVNCTAHIDTYVKVISCKKQNDGSMVDIGSHSITVILDSALSSSLDYDELYLIRPQIGEGSYGIVFKGEWRGQQVAVKLLKNQESTATVQDFDREVDTLSKLRCPQIIYFYGAIRQPGKLAIITEFMSLGNLICCVKAGKITPLLKTKCLLDISRGMLFLHEASMIHRDLKGENILMASLDISAVANCKITDFGTSRDINKVDATQKYTIGIGTPAFLPPEQLEQGKYNAKADVYSFAMVMYQVLTEKDPYFEFESLWKIAEFVISGKRLSLEGIKPPYDELIQKCWAQDPHDRPGFADITKVLEKSL